MEGIDLDLQVHLVISTHKTAFNVAHVHWSRLAKGCYTSQTCFCYWILFLWVAVIVRHDWLRKWLGAKQVTFHYLIYLNQWWLSSVMPLSVTQAQWVKLVSKFAPIMKHMWPYRWYQMLQCATYLCYTVQIVFPAMFQAAALLIWKGFLTGWSVVIFVGCRSYGTDYLTHGGLKVCEIQSLTHWPLGDLNVILKM